MSNKALVLICVGILLLFLLGAVIFGGSKGVKGASTFSPKITRIPGMSYSLSEIAKHKDAHSCWVVLNGKVYDLTSWVMVHPGGDMDILSLCGKDGTQAFNSQHFGDSGPVSYLNSFEIGTLSK